MEAKVAALESELSEVRSALAEVQSMAKSNQEQLIAMFTKSLGRSFEDSPKKIRASPILRNLKD